jgi:hypothetical protein
MKSNHIWAVKWVRKMMQAEVNRRRAGQDKITAPKPTFAGFLALTRGFHNRRARRMGWNSDLNQ